MTREEAIERLRWKLPDRKMIDKLVYAVDLVDAMIALDILKVDEPEDEAFKAAGLCLDGKFVEVVDSKIGPFANRKLTLGGAYEVLDILRKSGFMLIKVNK